MEQVGNILYRWFLGLVALGTFVYLVEPLAATGKAGISIHFLEKVEVNDTQIRLKDVAIVKGPPQIVEDLKNLVVGKAVNFGRTRQLSSGTVFYKAFRGLREEWNIEKTGAEQIRISTASHELNADTIKTLMHQFLRDSEAAMPLGPKLDYEVVSMPKTLYVPLREHELFIERQDKGDLKGMQKFSLNIVAEDKVLRRIPLQFFVRQFDSVWVAGEKIRRNTKLQKSQIRKEYKDITRVSGNPIQNFSSLEGSMTRQTVTRGRVLTTKLFRLKPLIHQGQEVEVLSLKSGLSIKMNGIARQDGAVGEVIKVKNLVSNKLVKAQVLENGKLALVSL